MKTAGFTLLELLLALVIAAVIGAMVIPMAGGMLSDRRLIRAGDQVRAELTRLRVHAIREGQVMMLQSNPNSGELTIVPKFTAAGANQSSDAPAAASALLSGAKQAMAAATPEVAPAGSGWTLELPENVVVRSVVTSPVGGTNSVEAAALNTAAPVAATGTGAPPSGLPIIYFYPTGQTSNAIMTIGNQTQAGSGSSDPNVVRVQVRGLTGDVTMRDTP